MFDDVTTNQAPPPGNLPLEPEDILAGVDDSVNVAPDQFGTDQVAASTTPNALGAGLLKKKTPESFTTQTPQALSDKDLLPTGAAPVTYAVKGPVLGKVLLVFFGGLAVVGISLGGWWGYHHFFSTSKTSLPVSVVKQTPVNPEPTPVVGQPVTVPTSSAPVVTVVAPLTPDNATNTVTAKMKNDQILFGETVDTDHDGIDDQREKELGTDPRQADTDGDGLSDGEEVIVWKTDPLNPDTDGDGYPDAQEVHNHYNPLGPGKLTQIVK